MFYPRSRHQITWNPYHLPPGPWPTLKCPEKEPSSPKHDIRLHLRFPHLLHMLYHRKIFQKDLSGWVEPELGRPTLGLGRVGHSVSARRVGPDKHFWPSGLVGFGFLSDGLNRTGLFVRRAPNPNFGSYKKLGLGGQP